MILNSTYTSVILLIIFFAKQSTTIQHQIELSLKLTSYFAQLIHKAGFKKSLFFIAVKK